MAGSRLQKESILRNPSHKKAPDVSIRGFFADRYLGFGLNFIRLQAFLALHRDEGHLLAFFQALEAAALNSAEMDEQIRTAFWRDKTKTLFVVKPLDGTALTIRHFLISLELELMTVSFA
jgi:hypothetical protein